MRLLSDIAHARAGDKGDTSIIVAAVHESAHFALLCRTLSLPALAVHFGVPESSVQVHAVPGLNAATVVISGRLDGGVTRSRTSDPHGKTLSGHLLELPCPGEDASGNWCSD